MRKTTRQAFTLMEVLLAIALIAICGGLAALGVSLFSEDTLRARPPDRLFCSALRFAQSEAISSGECVSLSYSEDGYFLVKEKSTLREIRRIWLSKELEDAAKKNDTLATPPNLEVSFVLNPPQTIGNENIEFKLKPATEVEISPDGVCNPITVYFSYENEDPTILKIDPMSASPKDF